MAGRAVLQFNTVLAKLPPSRFIRVPRRNSVGPDCPPAIVCLSYGGVPQDAQ
jgi:hypothetical protein